MLFCLKQRILEIQITHARDAVTGRMK